MQGLGLIRWILLLLKFDVEIKDKKGLENVVVDRLSTLDYMKEEQDKESSIKVKFPYEYLYSLNLSNTPWYADYANYLAFEILPSNLSYQQKKKFFFDVKHYLREDPFLFKDLQMA